ncbi:MAG: BPL-N domain-containing protein [Candidatus Pacearchaeota archaeon]
MVKKRFVFFVLEIFIIFTILPSVFALQGADFAVYTGSGTWEPSITAFEKFLEWKNLTYEEVSAWDINNNDLRPLYGGIFIPGGWAYNYKKSIHDDGDQNIRNLISSGGFYIGMSAGAYYACDNVRWEGTDYPYYLNLFHGDCIGPIDEIAPWPDYVMTSMSINQNHEANIFEPATEDILYYGEPYFVSYEGQEMQTFASWNVPLNLNADKQPGIIGFNYGQGRVLLVGPHPEIEENSDRDGNTFASELNDNGSDWPFLWTAVDWLMKEPISQPPELPQGGTGNISDGIPPTINSISATPNPVISGNNLVIKANVTDNVKVNSVWVNIFEINYPMSIEYTSGGTIFSDNFEFGNLNGWITSAVSGGNKWIVSTTNPYQGVYYAQSKPMSTTEPASVLEKAISTIGYNGITLKYARRLVGLDAADEFKAKWFDGTNWYVLEQTGKNSANDANYVVKIFSLPSAASNNLNFRIKFECTAGAVSEFCRVDNVNISSSSIATGFYKYVYSTLGLINGSYTYAVYANDSNGNQPVPSVEEFVVL